MLDVIFRATLAGHIAQVDFTCCNFHLNMYKHATIINRNHTNNYYSAAVEKYFSAQTIVHCVKVHCLCGTLAGEF